MNNKEALTLFNTGSFSEAFVRYLENKRLDVATINKFLIKAKQIYTCLSVKSKDIGMLVGKVQSGKTTVFSGVIARYFDKGYDLCIILTSIENLLNDQTNERMHQIFKSQNPSKVDIFQCDTFLIRNTNKRLEKIHDDLNKGHKYIVTILKNKQIEKINEVLITQKIWRNKKILIIDDEADLASIGSNANQEERYANNAIRNMLNTLPNYNYLSVTATPQAQVLINDDDIVKPKHVFTYEPGVGYMGLEEFFDEKQFFKLIDDKEWNQKQMEQLPLSLREAVIRYFVNISALILKQNKIVYTTMLVHTSIAIDDHYYLMRLLIKFKDNFLLYLNLDPQSVDYKMMIDIIRKVFIDANYSHLNWDNDYIELIKKIIQYTNVNIINSESDDQILENLNNIVLGSRKVERGVTLENLLLTYITNFHKKSTAVDTVLQRARWFGYRGEIKEFLTIYMVQSLYDQYRDYIIPSETELWKRLQEAEINDSFTEFKKYISLSGKSAPTNKIKTRKANENKYLFYDANVERELEVERHSKAIYLFFSKLNRVKFNISKRPYTALLDVSFDDFCHQVQAHKIFETIGIDEHFWNEIHDKCQQFKFIILFLDDAGQNDFRERTPEDNKYQLFEGANEDSNFPGEASLYKVDGLHNKIIVCLHKIRDKNDLKLHYYVSLHLPINHPFVGKFFTA